MGYTLGVIGAGNMAEAVIKAALAEGLIDAGQIIASDPSAERRGIMAQLGVTATQDNVRVVRESEQILLAIKPQTAGAIAGEIAGAVTQEKIVLSIMAGIGTSKLEAMFGKALRAVRLMPNTPLMVGLGMTGVAMGAHARAGDEALAMKLFTAGDSRALVVEEQQIDAITALSGSGPAYIFYLAEAMEQAASELGLTDDARWLVAQTIVGAAKLLTASSDTAAELRKKVSSPGGTTEAAISHMEQQQVRQAIVDAIKAAQRRGVQLGQ
jgi:pyrroline-5-carboxylate reductase